MTEEIGVGIAALVAGGVFYATFPVLLSLVMPTAPVLWEPILSVGQTLSVVGVFVGAGLLLAVANRLRFARATGSAIVPVLVWVLLLAVVASVITVLVAAITFGVTYRSMLSVGASSSAALAMGLIVGLGAWLILSRK